jgi:DNA-binding response OmpR family regulator
VASAPSATILVLEENAAVQELIDQTLREPGVRVLTTANALEALEVLRRVRIDVLILGCLLEERGHALISEFRSTQPDVRIVHIAGADDDPSGSNPGSGLSSPFSLDGLREAVTASLEEL